MRTLFPTLLLGVALLAGPSAHATVTTTFNAGQLVVTSVDEVQLTLACATGNVTVNGALPPDAGAVPCATVTGIVANGNALDNQITLAAVIAADFPLLTASQLNGGDGADTLVGSFQADTLNGNGGNDTLDGDDNPLATTDQVLGGDGDDTMTWNPGKDDDVNVGGAGNDTSVIVGGGAGEVFAITAVGGTVHFERTLSNGAPAAFFVDITETELLRVNANAGNDVLTAATLPVGLIALELNGGDGDDTLTGGDGADIVRGDIGNDTLDGDDNPLATTDQVLGGDGDDTMIWNPGKDDDVNVGGAGNDTSVIVGGGAGEVFAITAVGGTVHFERTLSNGAPAAFFVDITETELLRVNANAGNDVLTAATLPVGLIALELNGGDGDDTLTGGDGADIVRGDIGNDTLDGDDNPLATTDQVLGGDGDDTMTWNPGKDDDVNVGGAGNDTSVIVGGGAGEVFAITAVGGTVHFERTLSNGAPAAFFVDITETELLRVNANAGDDVLTAATLPVGLIALELNGGDGDDTLTGGDGADIVRGDIGNDTLDGDDNPLATTDQVLGGDGDDTMTWNPGKDDDVNVGGAGNDVAVINGGGAAEVFGIAANGAATRLQRTTSNGAPAAFFVDITETEQLRVNANAGDDTIDASTLGAGAIALELNGGDGNDSLKGGPDADLIRGGAGNDTLQPGENPLAAPDQSFGNEGDDVFLWNAGEDSDVNDGGDGNDSVIVNAAGADETFEIERIGSRTHLVRTLPSNFVLDNGTIESLQLNAGAGDDIVNTLLLPDVAQVLDGGAAATAAGDRLTAAGYAGDASVSPILKPGFGAIEHSGFERAQAGREGGSFSALLEGAQEVPPVATPATGRGTVSLNASETEITVQLSFQALGSNSTMAHIHGPAAPGFNAPPIFNLTGVGGTSAVLGPFVFAVTPQQVQDLKSGLWYFNVHSVNAPGGEIRGQILTDIVLEAIVEQRQVVPRSNSSARGFATVTLAGTSDQVVVTLVYNGLVGESAPGVSTAVRIHGPAARGSNGGAISGIVLPVSGLASDAFVSAPFAITPAQADELRDGLWYIEVESQEFPAAEIRGQFTGSIFFDNFE